MSGKINTVTWKTAALCLRKKCSFLNTTGGATQCLQCLHCNCVDISGYDVLYCDGAPESYLPSNLDPQKERF